MLTMYALNFCFYIITYTLIHCIGMLFMLILLFIMIQNQPQCSSGSRGFHWFIHEVYPGLLLDLDKVISNFRAHVSSSYLEKVL